MPTLVRAEANEHQTTRYNNGAAAFSIVTASPIDGTAMGHLAAAGPGAAYSLYNFPTDSGIYVASILWRYSTLPPLTDQPSALNIYANSSNQSSGICVDSSGNWALLGAGAATGGDPPVAVVANQIYRLEIRVDMTGVNWVTVGRVTAITGPDDATSVASSLGTATAAYAQNPTGVRVDVGYTQNSVWVANWTDLLMSLTSADYPIGPVVGRGYIVDAVGTHNLDVSTGTSTFFFEETSAPPGGTPTALTVAANVETNATPSYTMMDELPLGSGNDCVKITTATVLDTISRIGVVSAAATTLTETTHQVGDLLIAFVFRSASSTAPTIPGGWTQIGISTQTGSTKGWWGLYGKIATGTTGEVGTWTSATSLSVAVYRGAALPATAQATLTSGVSTSLNYAARAINDTSHDWLAAFAMTPSSGANTTPTGLSIPTGYTEVATRGVYDSNGVRGSNWSSLVQTITSQAWGTAMLDLEPTSSTVEPTNTWYAEYGYANESVITSAPLGVRALVVTDLDTAVATTWAAKLFDGDQGTNTEDIYNASLSTVVKTYQDKIFAQRPNSGGSWTLAALNALRLRFGYTAAADGHPRAEGVMIEAYFPITTALPFDTVQGALHDNPASLQVIGQAVKRGAYFFEKWTRRRRSPGVAFP